MCVTWYDFHFMITWLLEDRRSKILNMKSWCEAVIWVRDEMVVARIIMAVRAIDI